MATEFTHDVFLSHSSKDKTVVRELAARLKKDGVRVWLDEEQIKPGHSIPAKIEEGLEHSRVLVLCMSANAFGSDWAGGAIMVGTSSPPKYQLNGSPTNPQSAVGQPLDVPPTWSANIINLLTTNSPYWISEKVANTNNVPTVLTNSGGNGSMRLDSSY